MNILSCQKPVLKLHKNQLGERCHPFPNRFEVFWRGVHDRIVGWRVRAVAGRLLNDADSIPFGNVDRLLEIPFCWDVRERVKTRVSHEIVGLEEGEGVLPFFHRQHYFKADLCQQRLYVNEVEFSPPFLVEMAPVDGHEVDKKAMDGVTRNITQSDSVLFCKGQWDAQLQSMG